VGSLLGLIKGWVGSCVECLIPLVGFLVDALEGITETEVGVMVGMMVCPKKWTCSCLVVH